MYIENMYDRYLVGRWTYLMGEPILSDVEYDATERQFKSEYPDDIHSKQPWSFDECPVEQLGKYGLESLIKNTVMGYRAESISSVNTRDKFKEVFGSLCKKSRLSFKIDGWNTRVSYYDGVMVKVETRGRSGNNLNANGLAPLFPKTIPIKGRVAVTGEMSIPNKAWVSFKLMTGNNDQRASVRTALAQCAVQFLSFLAFDIFIEDGYEYNDQYELLQSLGFKTPYFKWVYSFEELTKRVDYMSYVVRGYDYLVDGLVLENEDFQLAIRLGAWEEHAMYSYVTGYEEDPGMYGVFYKIKVSPVTVEGKTFPRVSVNNIATIVENNLRIGLPVAFNLRSSANVVLNATETAQLQAKWNGRYEEYKRRIEEGRSVTI